MLRARYSYKTSTRCAPLVVIGAWLATGGCLFIFYCLRAGYIPALERQWGFWAPWLFLTVIGLGIQVDYIRRFRPLEVADVGLWLGGEGRKRSELIPWDDINLVERFPLPGHPRYARQRGGVRVIASRRSVVIYENIQGFGELRKELEQHLSRRGISVPR